MGNFSFGRSIENKDDNEMASSSSSKLQQFVCLDEWWLIKAAKEVQGKRLAVAGFTSRDQEIAVRFYSSAPILRIHDVFTLETTDGKFVKVRGLINKVQTEENGFPSEIFDYFIFGFPPQWEECAEKFMGGRCVTQDVSRVNETTKTVRELIPENCDKPIPEASHVDGEINNVRVQENNVPSSNVSDPKPDLVSRAKGLKKSNKKGRYTSRLGADNKNCDKVAATEKESTSDKASPSWRKTKRKLIYENPITQSQEGITSIVSPESLSSRRSRSGRLLLPTLEFWRNQTAIYDADRRVTGIRAETDTPLRGTRSKPQRKQK